MAYKIKINTENDIFVENESVEIARILKNLAKEIETYGIGKKFIKDINGNKVGYAIIE